MYLPAYDIKLDILGFICKMRHWLSSDNIFTTKTFMNV
jgi:hypothetical protein